jgi:hypothetical protein
MVASRKLGTPNENAARCSLTAILGQNGHIMVEHASGRFMVEESGSRAVSR